MIEKLLSELPSKDLFSLLQAFEKWLVNGAESLHISPVILYWIGVAVAVCVGLTCYKLMKLWLGALAAVAGYYLTGNGLVMLFKVGVGKDVPIWVYVVAVAVALVLFLLAFKSPTYVFYTFMAIVGFSMAYFYTQNAWVALLGALLLALVCVFLMRVAFILASSLVGGTLTVYLLGAIFPRVEALQLKAGNWTAMGVVVGISLAFAVFQLALSLRKGKAEGHEDKTPKAPHEKAVQASLFSFN